MTPADWMKLAELVILVLGGIYALGQWKQQREGSEKSNTSGIATANQKLDKILDQYHSHDTRLAVIEHVLDIKQRGRADVTGGNSVQ